MSVLSLLADPLTPMAVSMSVVPTGVAIRTLRRRHAQQREDRAKAQEMAIGERAKYFPDPQDQIIKDERWDQMNFDGLWLNIKELCAATELADIYALYERAIAKLEATLKPPPDELAVRRVSVKPVSYKPSYKQSHDAYCMCKKCEMLEYRRAARHHKRQIAASHSHPPAITGKPATEHKYADDKTAAELIETLKFMGAAPVTRAVEPVPGTTRERFSQIKAMLQAGITPIKDPDTGELLGGVRQIQSDSATTGWELFDSTGPHRQTPALTKTYDIVADDQIVSRVNFK